MKKTVLLLCCLLDSLRLFGSCNDDSVVTDSDIVGKWQLTKYKGFDYKDKFVTVTSSDSYREYQRDGKVKFHYSDGTEGLYKKID